MDGMTFGPLAAMAQLSLETNAAVEGDYMDAEGYLCCGKCGGRKQSDVTVPGVPGLGIEAHTMRVGVACPCRRAELARQEEQENARRHAETVERLKRAGMPDPAYRRYTFEGDNAPNSSVSQACRKYVQKWTAVRKNNLGILLLGGVGTGKSYYACAIANALMEREVSAYVTNLPDLVARMTANYGDAREEILGEIARASLLVLDDLGAEHHSEYALTQIFAVVDARARANKPLIVTTNLNLRQLVEPDNLACRRIYDRVLEMCAIRLRMDGQSRRAAGMSARQQLAQDILRSAT